MLTNELLTFSDLHTGDQLGRFTTDFTSNTVAEFVSIADPSERIYSDCATALAYDTLHAVKHFVELPQGTVHSKEAVQFHSTINQDEPCVIDVSVADVGTRRGKRAMCIQYDVHSGDKLALTALKTFVLPGKSDEADTDVSNIGDFGLFPDASRNAEAEGLALQSRTIEVTQSLLDEFGRVTATDGSIHTDPAIATPLFGGTILQGMYLFETASQMMAELSSPEQWLSKGSLAAKIIGSSITGETVTMSARLLKVTSATLHQAECAITATTDTDRTVFIARASGPLSAFDLDKETNK